MEITNKDFRAHLLPILLAQALGFSIGVIGLQLASHWVAPADYGVYGLFVSLTPLGIGVIHIGLQKYVSRHWVEAPDRGALIRDVQISGIRKLPWLAAGAALAALLIPGTWSWNFLPLFCSAAALSASGITQAAMQAERRNWRDLAASCAVIILRTGVPIACYMMISRSATVLLLGFAAQSMVAALVVAAIAGWLTTPGNGQPPSVPEAFTGARFTLIAAVGWGMGASGRWIAAEFFGIEQAGYFVLATNVALIAIGTLYAVVQQFFQPRLFALPTATEEDITRLTRTTDWLVAGFVVISASGIALLTLLMPYLIGTVIGPKYASAVEWVPAAGAYHIAVLIPTFFNLMMLAGKRSSQCGPAEITASVAVLAGGLVAAYFGAESFRWFAIGSPLLAWGVGRPIAMRAMRQCM